MSRKVDIVESNATVFFTTAVVVVVYIKSSLKPVRIQLDIDASPCVEMICCWISTFPSQTSTLAVYRNPNSTSSYDFLVLQAIQHVATALGECLIVGDFYTPAVD